MFLIDTHNKKAVSLEKKSFSELKLSERYDLQEWIADKPSILGENLLILQKEFDGFLNTNERLDLLALDESGKLVVIEKSWMIQAKMLFGKPKICFILRNSYQK